MNAARRCDLAHPAGVDQAEVGDDGVDRARRSSAPARAAGRAARSGGRRRRGGRCRRSASATAARCRARRRASRRWCGRRPRSPRARGSRPAARAASRLGVGEMARRGAVHAPHFLQEHEVGVERLDAEHRGCGSRAASSGRRRARPCGCCRSRRAARRSGAGCGSGRRSRAWMVEAASQAGQPAGSCRIASAFDGEKQASAASRQAASDGAGARAARARTGSRAARARPNTCSVLRVTPGA